MTRSDRMPGRADRIGWAITIVCLLGTGYLMAMSGMMDAGAAAHDAFCPEHGWAVQPT